MNPKQLRIGDVIRAEVVINSFGDISGHYWHSISDRNRLSILTIIHITHRTYVYNLTYRYVLTTLELGQGILHSFDIVA